MRAGELRYRVIIQQKAITQDSYGAPVETWSTFATVWAAIDPLQGREFFDAQRVNAEITIRIRIRYRASIVPTMRVKHGSRLFDIQSVINVGEKNRELQLLCKETVS